ncbi:hypothetical protein [Brevundimonas sp.]|uniref:hypothetical protein n=1 Tax=Brevundimonas sp. TaxID=1871086 RepID=UPI003AF62D4B
MKRLIPLIPALLLAVAPAPLLAQTPTPAAVATEVTEWPLTKIVALGTDLYRHDQAAWVATDVFLAFLGDERPSDIVGWIVTGTGTDLTVRFLRRAGEDDLRPGWDIRVVDGVAGPVVAASDDAVLGAADKAQFRARQTAIAALGRPPCSRNMNTVVLADPDSEDWLVWLLTPVPDARSVPVGGHIRHRVSADGLTLLSREPLSRSCLTLEQSDTPEGSTTAGLFATHIVSDTPVETHVFLSLQSGLPLYVGTGDGVWRVDGATIEPVEVQP